MSNTEGNVKAEVFGRYARCTLVILWTTCSALAQTFGELAGFVQDASGGAVAGVRIMATEQATNQSRSATTKTHAQADLQGNLRGPTPATLANGPG